MNEIKKTSGFPTERAALLDGPVKDERDPKMMEAARAFEGQFIRQMVQQMRKTVPEDDVLPASMGERVFREELDNEYAEKWTNQGGIGLSDMIYQHLAEDYGGQKAGAHGKIPIRGQQQFYPIEAQKNQNGQIEPMGGKGHTHSDGVALPYLSRPVDIFSKHDGEKFLAKKEAHGFSLKSREPLTGEVKIHSPLPGVVLQAAALEDGRNFLVVQHDQGLVSRFVYNGDNRVKTGTHVLAGQVIASLKSPSETTSAKVFFELRPSQKVE